MTSSYTDNTITSYADDPLTATAFKAVHIRELRTRSTSGAGNSTSGGSSGGLHYVLSDLQGTTRAVMNNNGSSSAVVARHDYLPFGEEIGSGLGLRTPGQGYSASDTNRWKYGMLQRDAATGLDHAGWRKYESSSGRWTSPDPYMASMTFDDPQSFNRYPYSENDPVNFIDPSGLCTFNINIRNNARLSSGALDSMRNEIRRIFNAAGQNVVFNAPKFPRVNSAVAYTINVQSGGSDPGWTPRDATDVIQNVGYASTDRLRESIELGHKPDAMGDMHPTNFGRALGRVAAHESIHYLLQMHGHSASGLMQEGFSGSTWFRTSDNATFQLTSAQANLLGAKCGPLSTDTTVPNNQPTTRGPFGGGESNFTGGVYLSSSSSLQGYLNWVGNIGGGYGEVIGYKIGSPKRQKP